MFATEYVRNCNCNYERVALPKKPEENRYQYCILSRGGIRYLLPCSLRYINGEAFLYYDISSTQNVVQMFAEKKINREWIKDFLWGVKQMDAELDRYLLENRNVIWNPEHIFQDLEKNDFFFLYMPYYEGENGLDLLMDFWVEHVDYNDEPLVEFVYMVYERVRTVGVEYFDKQIHEDFLQLEKVKTVEKEKEAMVEQEEPKDAKHENISVQMEEAAYKEVPRRKIRFFWEWRRKKQSKKDEYRESLRQKINGAPVYAVCEESTYGAEEKVAEGMGDIDFAEEFGKTIYIEETMVSKVPGLYKLNGELVMELTKFPFVIGKKRENVDLVINDYSASRIHARITQEDGIFYLEDLNSTNGTFKNGLRLQPYEKRKLESGDELKFGNTEYTYK